MILAVIFGALVGLATHGTVHKEDCEKRNNEPSACVTTKVLGNLGNLGK
jgi:hypothetical protein